MFIVYSKIVDIHCVYSKIAVKARDSEYVMWARFSYCLMRCESQVIFDLFLIIFLSTVIYVFCVTDLSVFCSNSARKCGIMPA